MNRLFGRRAGRAFGKWSSICLFGGLAAVVALGGRAPHAAEITSAERAKPTERSDSSRFSWRSLSAAERRALHPLEGEWGGLDLARRQKWLEIADRFPTLSASDQERAQERMAQWAQLSPEDRGKARMLFQEAKQVSPSDRGSKWEAYQSLPEEARQQLGERAVDTRREAARGPESRRSNAASDARVGSGRKSNLVPNPAFAAPPVAVAPTVTQAGPGATTSLMSTRPEPPRHQHTGLPKIAATPIFVDQATLLPKRGAQAAETRSPTASAPVPRP